MGRKMTLADYGAAAFGTAASIAEARPMLAVNPEARPSAFWIPRFSRGGPE